VGLAVHATARVNAAAHGGQIVVTRAALRAMQDELPSDVTTTELGTHRLRGLPEPETLYQLSAPDLPRRFPPVTVS